MVKKRTVFFRIFERAIIGIFRSFTLTKNILLETFPSNKPEKTGFSGFLFVNFDVYDKE